MKAMSFRQRMIVVIGLGVALPALALAALGVFLTLRIADAVEAQSVRYSHYMAQQVVEAYETELLAHLREAVAPAENAARLGQSPAAILAGLREGTREFSQPEFIPLHDLSDHLLLVVQSQPLVYGADARGSRGLRFAGMMLRDSEGEIMGAGGWWIDPGLFLERHVNVVIEERLASNNRIYGGIESTRNLGFDLLNPRGRLIARFREPEPGATSGTAAMEGPFEGYSVRVTPTGNAPVAWARRFVLIEVLFIALMGLAIVCAAAFGLRYTVRQLELARIKSSFVSNVSHELKTPIALIRLAVETLEMGRVTSPQESEKFIRLISRETTRLNQLVDNILDFARLEAGQRVFKFTDVDLGEVVRETLDSYRLRLEDQGFHLTLEVPEDLPLIRGEPAAIAQCLLNLLDNAIKYSRQKKEIHVSVAARNSEVAVSVRDRGLGIPEHDQKRVFEKFVRLETGLVHDVKGAGLGLSLVDQIVRAHGGRVELTSTPGEGSTFTLVFPAGAAGGRVDEPEARTAS
jgi:histidine kinase/DNA gyrase B/HSP90-like ATPase/phospho-acceptor domain-containing protein